MKFEEEDYLIRIFLKESSHWKGAPLYEKIVLKAKELGLAGATVLRGVMGFGAHKHLHTAKLVDLSADMPIVIEILDTEEKIHDFMPFIDEVLTEGFVTVEKLKVFHYKV